MKNSHVIAKTQQVYQSRKCSGLMSKNIQFHKIKGIFSSKCWFYMVHRCKYIVLLPLNTENITWCGMTCHLIVSRTNRHTLQLSNLCKFYSTSNRMGLINTISYEFTVDRLFWIFLFCKPRTARLWAHKLKVSVCPSVRAHDWIESMLASELNSTWLHD